MNSLSWRRLAAFAALSAVSSTAGALALNSPDKDQADKVKLEPEQKTELPVGFVTFGHLVPTSSEIVILAETAIIKIRRDAKAQEVTIASPCPRDWNISGNVIRQAGFSKSPHGVSMRADALGSRAIVNGKIYPLPTKGPFKMTAEGVEVDGQKIEPLKGSDLPGSCDGPDSLEVIVPESYSGGLTLGAGGSSEVEVVSWQGGAVSCTLLGNANLSAGKLNSLAKAVIDMRSAGKAQIGDVSAKVLVANVEGHGSLNIQHGSADMSNATVSGDGEIKMHGQFKNLKQSIEGNGKIQVN